MLPLHFFPIVNVKEDCTNHFRKLLGANSRRHRPVNQTLDTGRLGRLNLYKLKLAA